MTNVQNVKFEKIDGHQSSLAEYHGRVVLVVNVASKCGLTPQYEGLEKIYRQYKDRGFEILGFPANNFLGQEPGSNEEIQSFCQTKYQVSFPIVKKISAKGADRHPLYSELISAKPKAEGEAGSNLEEKLSSMGITRDEPAGLLWNFEKFLIDREGKVAARFAPDVKPESELLTKKIESLLG
jgi:glutathione peroxidase